MCLLLRAWTGPEDDRPSILQHYTTVILTTLFGYSHWFTRQFPWGKCEVLSSNHSDLPALKSLLFEWCFEGLKAATEARFYSARETYLTTRALSRALSSNEPPVEPKPR